MHRVKRPLAEVRWPDALAQVMIGLIASFILNKFAADETIRDIGIVAFWLAIIVGGMALLAVRMFQQAKVSEMPPATATEAARIASLRSSAPVTPTTPTTPAAPPPRPLVTGETKIRTAQSLGLHGGTPDQIDYYIPTEYDRFNRLNSLGNLNLAEIALLRRLAVASNQTQNSRRCQAVLQAAGVYQPGASIARLEDMKLLTVDSADSVSLTERGAEYVWAFTQWLTHDPTLSWNYRQITPRINNTIRFDGRSLTP